MKVLKFEKVVLAEDLEIVAVTTGCGTTYLGGGITVRLDCDHDFLSHLANHLHGAAWVDDDQAYLYIRDLGALDNLRHHHALAGSLKLLMNLGKCREDQIAPATRISWVHHLSPPEHAAFLDTDGALACPARPFTGALQVTDYYGSHNIWNHDQHVLRVPGAKRICRISPDPVSLNGNRFRHDGPGWRVDTVIHAVQLAGVTGDARSAIYALFAVDGDGVFRSCVSRHQCETCGYVWVEVWDEHHGVRVPHYRIPSWQDGSHLPPSVPPPKPAAMRSGVCPAC